MLAEYTGVLVVFAIGAIIVSALLAIHLLLGPRRRFAEKQEPFECGERQLVSPRQRYAVKFYMVAISFIVFDLETIFIIPWAVQMRELGWSAFLAMSMFVAVLAIGLVYEWKKGGLEWD